MKKRILFTILPLVGLFACSGINESNFVSQAPENNDLNHILLKELADDEVLLNLTVNGLYNGEKGESSSEYNLENYVIVNLNVGDALPTKDTITSTVLDVEFTTWQYATDEGELAFVDIVQEGQKFYQAYFTYLGDGEEDNGVSFDGGLTSEDTSTPRVLYMKNNAGWSSVNIYAWNSYRTLSSWPGLSMEVYDATSNIYYYELSSIYENVIFNSDGTQTADLKIYENVNIYTISLSGTQVNVEYGWYENGVITPVDIQGSVSSDSPYYFRGSNNGWGTDPLTKVNDDCYTITLDLTSGTEFKIANADWTWETTTLQGSAASNFSGGNGEFGNLKCNVTGNYTFTLTPSTKVIDVVKN